MPYWTQKKGNITNVQAVFDDVFSDIGYIEQPYKNEQIYIAVYDNQMLKNEGGYIFFDFDAAYQAVINAYEGRLNSERV
jgi:hypothetical protein